MPTLTAGPRDGAAQLFYIVALGALILYAAYIGASILIPLVVAGFLAFLIVTLKNTIANAPVFGRRLPNWLAFFAAFLAIIGGFFGILSIIRPSIGDLIAAAPEYQERLREILRAAEGALDELNVIESFLREQGWISASDGEPLLMQIAGQLRFGAIFSQVAGAVRNLAANKIVQATVHGRGLVVIAPLDPERRLP